MKKLVVGILAHVDAGKTTLSEGLLYTSGQIRRRGRVDHKDAFLDTYQLEKERGITIFSKQAVLTTHDTRITLLDTPGHADFSAEMERTLRVLDYCILVISGPDGVQGHTMTLWKLLQRYQIPTFLFVNKMDQPGTDRKQILQNLTCRLGEGCIDFTPSREAKGEELPEKKEKGEALPAGEKESPQDNGEGPAPLPTHILEEIAMCDEALMDSFLETESLSLSQVQQAILSRQVFPCYYGSALHMEGVEDFLLGLCTFAREKAYPEGFAAQVYKISRDEAGNRLTYVKLTGGSLKVKALIEGGSLDHRWEEKVDQIRLYSGAKYTLLKEAQAGESVVLTGLSHTHPGDGLGRQKDAPWPELTPVLRYRLILPPGYDPQTMLRQMRLLEEEDPLLHVVWEEKTGQIHAMLMGEVQTEVYKRLIWDRFHVAVDFGPGDIVYRETILSPVIGVGHFEPLRHYAEVHLLLEPGERGSNLTFYTLTSEDVLDKNWQRLILTHLAEREHPGVLTGSSITDMQITLINGRAHEKHTEGGDFRQATYRAVRNGLKKAKSVLLEPWYSFQLELPTEFIGRAMTDIQTRGGKLSSPQTTGEETLLTGSIPVRTFQDYPSEVVAYTSGRGRLSYAFLGYEVCPDQEAIVQELGYDSESDLENPTGSVFCAHGAGYLVPWDEVESHMHLEDRSLIRQLGLSSSLPEESQAQEEEPLHPKGGGGKSHYSGMGGYQEDKELAAIFERTFGSTKSERSLKSQIQKFSSRPQIVPSQRSASPSREEEPVLNYLLVDGYNIIFGWPELNDLAQADIHAAQQKLIDILANFQGLIQSEVIIVFDAYKIIGHQEEVVKYHGIHVVYTKEAETADMFIEKTVHQLAKKHHITVATSDGLEQIIIMGQGASRLSATTLREEIQAALTEMNLNLSLRRKSSKTYLLDGVDEDTARWVEAIRKGEEGKKEAPDKGPSSRN